MKGRKYGWNGLKYASGMVDALKPVQKDAGLQTAEGFCDRIALRIMGNPQSLYDVWKVVMGTWWPGGRDGARGSPPDLTWATARDMME